jgi:hypothetical protein
MLDQLSSLANPFQRRMQSTTSPFWARRTLSNVGRSGSFVFIHIPKTGGTSMGKCLGLRKTTHATASEWREQLGLDYSNLYSFAFVRNPWDRFLSLYLYARMEESYHHSSIRFRRKRYGKHPDYETLRDASIETAAFLLLEGKLSFQWLPQCRWICNQSGKIMCNFVGRLESVRTDWAHVAAKTNAPDALSHKNIANPNRIPYREKINAETKQLLDIYYQQDIQQLGYQF